MSDTPTGPGWWQASDGKWYPPQPPTQPPPPVPGTPMPMAPQPLPAKNNNGCLIWGLVISGIVLVLGTILIITLVFAVDEAVDDFQEQQALEDQDASIGGCENDEFDNAVATIDVTNNSSETSDYLIQVVFESADGSVQIDVGSGSITALAPAQSTSIDVSSLQEITEDFDCRIGDVERFATQQ